jgi:putative NADH-flavin reductase
MRLLVLGATGGTGREVVRQALERSYEVTAFARRPEAVVARAGLRVVQGDITHDEGALAGCIEGQDAVVSALGRGPALHAEGLMQRGMERLVPAMEASSVRRLLVVSAYGVGETAEVAPLIPRLMYRTMLADLFADKKAAEDTVRAAALDWTIVRPVILTNGPMRGRYRAGESLALSGLPRISRADVAHFILGELAANRYVRKIVALAD